MQQIISYVGNTNAYHCPGNAQLPLPNQSPFNYFNGVRAAFVANGGFAAVKSTSIQFNSAYVLSGDTIDNGLYFATNDCDKDDYSQDCVGNEADVPANEQVQWKAHSAGQNILFSDGHAKWYKGYSATDMTFAYNALTNWLQGLP